MSTEKKNVVSSVVESNTENVGVKAATVPVQDVRINTAKVTKDLADVQEKAVEDVNHVLRMLEKSMTHVYAVGTDIKITRDDEGVFHAEIVESDESKVRELAGKAKGLFNRNKKLILATAGLAVSSAVLRALANRRELILEAEVVDVDDNPAPVTDETV